MPLHYVYLILLRGYSITNKKKFLDIFGSKNNKKNFKNLIILRVYRLQKFLLAYIVARPFLLLELFNIVEENIEFKLNKNKSKRITDFILKYIILRGKNKDKAVKNVTINLEITVRII